MAVTATSWLIYPMEREPVIGWATAGLDMVRSNGRQSERGVWRRRASGVGRRASELWALFELGNLKRRDSCVGGGVAERIILRRIASAFTITIA
jgi:hypothetical protein